MVVIFYLIWSKLDYVSVIFNYAISTDDNKFERIQWQLEALYYIPFFPLTHDGYTNALEYLKPHTLRDKKISYWQISFC